MNSYTSARVYITVPNAMSLNQSQLDVTYQGILGANVNWVRIPLSWSAIQPTEPIPTTIVTKVVTTIQSWLFSATQTVVTTVTTTVGNGTPTVTTNTTTGPSNVRTLIPWTSVTTKTTTRVDSTPTFTWTAADLAVNRALAAGLNVQVVLAPPYPSWVLKITPTTFTPFAQAVAQRYRPAGEGITATGRFVAEYQVWNEPNVVANWPASVAGGEYAAVLKAAQQVIKASHSGAVVVAAGLQNCVNANRPASGGTKAAVLAQEPVTYLNAMYAGGVKGYFDVAAYHPLTVPTSQWPDPPAPSIGITMKAADAFWTALKAKEPTKKVYWSQVGFHTPTVSQEQQAAYLDTMRWFAEERKDWVTGMALASWRDY